MLSPKERLLLFSFTYEFKNQNYIYLSKIALEDNFEYNFPQIEEINSEIEKNLKIYDYL